jgi:hypothetical protein
MIMPKAKGRRGNNRSELFDRTTIVEHLRSMIRTTITIVIMPMNACTVAIVTEFSKRKGIVVIFYF